MFLLNTVHSVAVIAERVICRIAPETRFSGWLCCFRSDAEALCLIADELERAATYTRPEHKMLAEFSVYHAAYFFADRQYHGMMKRWPRALLRSLANSGLRLDATQWQEGCNQAR
ncbi:hypothetical protein NYP83_02310 [Erwinia pyrifoliae]|uniref:hypothetical protein n=1 Tax=Erwinia pyrifoliae TaxID=79967 RepID=UPI0021D7BA0E|nr:hypothetical protein [Erwinia pyrifoliae]MCU8585775.1 hypothetical protein [Erwinia pyrifoliae]